MKLNVKTRTGIGYGKSIGIGVSERLLLISSHECTFDFVIDLGPASKTHIQTLIDALEHLKTHAT